MILSTNVKVRDPRPYRMAARALAAEATRRRVLEAAMSVLFGEVAEGTIESIAERAGVSYQTVIRIFGGKGPLLAEAAAEARRLVVDQRSGAPSGDIPASVKVLLIHYESYGDRLLRARARLQQAPELIPGVIRERADHRRWVARIYRPQLEAAGERRGLLLNALIAITDVATWEVLRRELALDRREVEATLTAMITAVAG